VKEATTEKSGVKGRIANEILQAARFKDAHLLLRILQRLLTELEKLRTTFVGRQKLFQRQLARFHGGDDIFQLGECALEGR
jgi:hypothetical protein